MIVQPRGLAGVGDDVGAGHSSVGDPDAPGVGDDDAVPEVVGDALAVGEDEVVGEPDGDAEGLALDGRICAGTTPPPAEDGLALGEPLAVELGEPPPRIGKVLVADGVGDEEGVVVALPVGEAVFDGLSLGQGCALVCAAEIGTLRISTPSDTTTEMTSATRATVR